MPVRKARKRGKTKLSEGTRRLSVAKEGLKNKKITRKNLQKEIENEQTKTSEKGIKNKN